MLVLEMPVCKKFYRVNNTYFKSGVFMKCFCLLSFSHSFFFYLVVSIYCSVFHCRDKLTWSWASSAIPFFLCVPVCSQGEVRGQPQLLFSGCHLHYFLFCSGFFVCFSDLRYFTDLGLEVDWSSWPTSPRNLFTSLLSLITGITNSYHHTCLDFFF